MHTDELPLRERRDQFHIKVRKIGAHHSYNYNELIKVITIVIQFLEQQFNADNASTLIADVDYDCQLSTKQEM